MERVKKARAGLVSLARRLPCQCLGLAGLIMLLGLAATALGAGLKQTPAQVPYKVVFQGVDDKALLDLLRQVSTTEDLAPKGAPSLIVLRGRVRADLPRLKAVLQSQGRLAGQVDTAIDQSASPVMVHFRITSAEPFILDKVDIKLSPGSPDLGFTLPQTGDLGLSLGGPALSKDIVAAAGKLVSSLKNHGHPFAGLAKQLVLADFAAKTVHVTYTLTPGPRAMFGPAEFSGLKEVKQSFVRDMVPWQPGEEYKQEKVDLLQQKLLNLGLFATVTAAPKKDLDAQGRVVVAVEVTERKQRTVKAGVNYKSDEGPGANFSWEHRNLWGQGERLRLNLSGSAINKTAEASFEKPFFLSPKQQFLADFKATDQNTTAYRGQDITAQAGLGRDLAESLKAKAGLGYLLTRIEEDAHNPLENDKHWGLIFIPLELTFNNRDDPLDPKKGLLLGLKAAPYLDTLGTNLSFGKAEIDAATYLQLLASPSVILALRTSLGSIAGAGASDVPPDLRFYAGGSSTVRGYPYQTVGPLRGTKPLGGDSIFDFGSELRVQVSEKIGVVAFLDGGNVYDQSFPDLSQGILCGAGLGLQVKTPVGPVRLDIATPLERRPKVDAPFQIYVSLGQAF